MATRRQHHVWCHYLGGWSRDNCQVYCSRRGNVFFTNPINIMVERDFYRLAPLTIEDIWFFKYWLEQKCEPSMRVANQSAFEIFVRVANGAEVVERLSGVADAEKEFARSLAIEAEEKLHQGIESRAIPLVDDLRQERIDFLDDQSSAINFFHFLAHQYFRTKKMRESVGDILKTLSSKHDFSRLRHLYCYCFANNFGGSLYCDRRRLDVVFLRNGDCSFVTGDQPVVNLGWEENMEHDDVALYYPLCPSLGVVIADQKYGCKSMKVSEEIARQLNRAISFASEQFLVGYSEEILRGLSDKPRKRPDVLALIV
ncbi:MAG: DUF4238 domain-containing protein [Gemmatimonadetes bacterium]|nr:DUF4238 domain-containing protein [Gemmatimonadota bacterium]